MNARGYNPNVGQGQALAGLTGAGQTIGKPKEIGILTRVDALRTGLQGLRAGLESFSDRLEGAASSNTLKGEACSSNSLTGTISDAENELRICRQMIDALHDRF